MWEVFKASSPASTSYVLAASNAVALLEELGGSAELEEDEAGIVIRGFGCPLGLAVHNEPRVCAALESLMSAVTGAEVRERCDRSGDAPSCRFVIAGRR